MTRTALFIPCIVDQFLPEIGIAMARCLAAAGLSPQYDNTQTCCGQVFLNAGFPQHAARLAQAFVRRFSKFDAVVAPSWSCVEMVRDQYGDLIRDYSLRREWESLRSRVFEVSDFLWNIGISCWEGRIAETRAILHVSCHAPKDPLPRKRIEQLLAGVRGLTLLPCPENECCGFGGIFMLTWRPVSAAIGHRRLEDLSKSNPDMVLLGEPGCTLQLRTVAKSVQVRHFVEVLSDAVI